MNYPEWAPEILVEGYKMWLAAPPAERGHWMADTNDYIAELVRRGISVTPDDAENIRQRQYRERLRVPDEERMHLVKLLITDLRMKDAWTILSKRTRSDLEFYEFFEACEQAIAGWRGDPKLTAAEKRAHYREVGQVARRLRFLLERSPEFDLYTAEDLIEGDYFECFLEDMSFVNQENIDKDMLRFFLAGPPANDVLENIAEKSDEYAKEENVVKQPNSPNAEIHYFIRSMSAYCMRKYAQPLHEVVAITTSVIFDIPNIDKDYVRKNIKR
ncbi:hypothetical protein SAMN05216420_10632 [Nitrosospira sp. Nl5]|uniref:hypothetical protein n=1 Tax=Nitrosospira sp. Nl5 TaxID=200120 RepID=UPI0008920943|nr:hypothetical protein [Nitrosospira sp. Nl5]SCY42311.1 hypothetical protein SAMN05216420_10632 [Nitrosospira sp. Nl5]